MSYVQSNIVLNDLSIINKASERAYFPDSNNMWNDQGMKIMQKHSKDQQKIWHIPMRHLHTLYD